MRKPSLYRRLRQVLSDFLFVLFHWREYHDIVLTLHQPWFDIIECDATPLYLNDPANLLCKFCGCRYGTVMVVRHRLGCLWLRIKKIHPYHR